MTIPTRSTIRLCSRTCVLCGTIDLSPATGQIVYWSPGRLPGETRCQNCGLCGLLPDEPKEFRLHEPEPVLDWLTDAPRKGRPPKALVEKRAREAAARAAAA